MCLNTVQQTENFPQEMIGYKVLKIEYDDNFVPPYYPHFIMQIGETYEDNNPHYINTSDESSQYKSGFHCSQELTDADTHCINLNMMGLRYKKKFVTFKVKMEQIVAIGTEHSGLIVVARKITLLEKVL